MLTYHYIFVTCPFAKRGRGRRTYSTSFSLFYLFIIFRHINDGNTYIENEKLTEIQTSVYMN